MNANSRRTCQSFARFASTLGRELTLSTTGNYAELAVMNAWRTIGRSSVMDITNFTSSYGIRRVSDSPPYCAKQ